MRLTLLCLSAVLLLGVGCEMHPPAPAKDKGKETTASKSDGHATPEASPAGETPRFFPESK